MTCQAHDTLHKTYGLTIQLNAVLSHAIFNFLLFLLLWHWHMNTFLISLLKAWSYWIQARLIFEIFLFYLEYLKCSAFIHTTSGHEFECTGTLVEDFNQRATKQHLFCYIESQVDSRELASKMNLCHTGHTSVVYVCFFPAPVQRILVLNEQWALLTYCVCMHNVKCCMIKRIFQIQLNDANSLEYAMHWM